MKLITRYTTQPPSQLPEPKPNPTQTELGPKPEPKPKLKPNPSSTQAQLKLNPTQPNSNPTQAQPKLNSSSTQQLRQKSVNPQPLTGEAPLQRTSISLAQKGTPFPDQWPRNGDHFWASGSEMVLYLLLSTTGQVNNTRN